MPVLKVVLPVAVNLVVGIVLLAFGETDLGKGVLIAAAVNAGVGYGAPKSS